uniref:DUF7808 domain-containing protein n=1 Tax=Plectus sambesii TaxID=2011161 RepID=A0A914UP92_9BILA
MFRSREICILLGSLFLIEAGQVFLPINYYIRPRILVCNYKSGNYQAACTMLVNAEKTEGDPECFSELDKNGRPKTYCRLLADDADWCNPIFKVPNDNHKCNKYYNYATERRDNVWYIWRTDKCLNQTISILVNCQWPQKSASLPVS